MVSIAAVWVVAVPPVAIASPVIVASPDAKASIVAHAAQNLFGDQSLQAQNREIRGDGLGLDKDGHGENDEEEEWLHVGSD